jgi:hypothetical protein
LTPAALIGYATALVDKNATAQAKRLVGFIVDEAEKSRWCMVKPN